MPDDPKPEPLPKGQLSLILIEVCKGLGIASANEAPRKARDLTEEVKHLRDQTANFRHENRRLKLDNELLRLENTRLRQESADLRVLAAAAFSTTEGDESA